jgi:hypothetical protein
MTLRKTLVTVLAAAAVLTSGGVAQARPVLDEPQWCGVGLTDRVFDWRTGSYVVSCAEPRELMFW